MASRSFIAQLIVASILLAAASAVARAEETAPKRLRAGIIGLDTSHVVAFTKIFNEPGAFGDIAGVRIVAAFLGGSPDIAESRDRVEGFTKQVKAMNVEIVDSIPTLLQKVDVVLLESVDGRPHLDQVRPVLEAGKPVFIDKPLAGSLVDAIAIAELAKKHNVPWFSSSSLRFGPAIAKTKADPKLGDIVGCDAWGPCRLEPHHPDLYWYGIHGCELLYTYMGTGCAEVSRSQTEGTDLVVGIWKDGRIGTFRGIRQGKQDYGAMLFGTKGVVLAPGNEGYKPLVEQIAHFFKTRQPPVTAEETIELMTFMEAADESKRQGGKPVKLETVLKKAQEQARSKLTDASRAEGVHIAGGHGFHDISSRLYGVEASVLGVQKNGANLESLSIKVIRPLDTAVGYRPLDRPGMVAAVYFDEPSSNFDGLQLETGSVVKVFFCYLDSSNGRWASNSAWIAFRRDGKFYDVRGRQASEESLFPRP